jgi:hypothetical protein
MLLLLLACFIKDEGVSMALDPDGDGFGPQKDCFPLDPGFNSAVMEIWYDGADQDCSGGSDFDQDGDGFASSTEPNEDGIVGADCDDLNEAVNPRAEERWYDGVDQNCDGADDFDQDGDGVPVDEDCWDDPNNGTFVKQAVGEGLSLTAADVYPSAAEAWYDGVDQNCDGADDFDQDGDGFQSANDERADGSVGDDCDDSNSAMNSSATEVCNTGLDEDCSGDDNHCSLAGDVPVAEADYRYIGTVGTYFGHVLASGDWNDDGSIDLAIGADHAEDEAGRVHIIYGPMPEDITLDLEEDAIFEGVSARDYLGISVGSGGDLDGDGVVDLLMGAYGYDNNSEDQSGAAVLFYGGSTWSGLIAPTSADARFFGDLGGDVLGKVTRFIGDVDGDGYDEIALGANLADNGGASSGAVYVIPGSVTPYAGAQAAGSVAGVVFAGDAGDRLGAENTLNNAFDLNGDGLADIAMGATNSSALGPYGGGVYFYYGDAELLYSGALSASDAADAWILPSGSYDSLGEGIFALGDVDGDGYDDLTIGAKGYEEPLGSLSRPGGLFLITGGSTRLSGELPVTTAATATVIGAASDEYFGDRLNGGDVNNDGLDDLVLGSRRHDHGGVTFSGAAFIFFGPVSGVRVVTDADAILAGPSASGAEMGSAVTVFDADDDGVLDVFVGASGSGMVYGYLGGGL